MSITACSEQDACEMLTRALKIAGPQSERIRQLERDNDMLREQVRRLQKHIREGKV